MAARRRKWLALISAQRISGNRLQSPAGVVSAALALKNIGESVHVAEKHRRHGES
jgi:hypothetical protein